MFRFLLLVAATLLPAAAFAQTVVPFDVGGATVKIEMPAGYQRVSQVAPERFAGEQASFAVAESLLLDEFVSDADVAAARAGTERRDTVYQVAVSRELATKPVTDRDMPAICEVIHKGFASDATKGMLPGVAATKPQSYGHDPDTVRMVFVVPAPASAGGVATGDGAVVVAVVGMLSDRIVQLQAVHACDGAACDRNAVLRVQADAFYGRARALNPRDYERVRSAPAGTR